MRSLNQLLTFVGGLRVPRAPKRQRPKTIQKFSTRKPRRPKSYSVDLKERVVEMYDRNRGANSTDTPYSIAKVAKIFNLPNTTVWNFVHRDRTTGD